MDFFIGDLIGLVGPVRSSRHWYNKTNGVVQGLVLERDLRLPVFRYPVVFSHSTIRKLMIYMKLPLSLIFLAMIYFLVNR